MAMQAEEILSTVQARYTGLREAEQDWGETVVFYNPDGKRERGFYFVTITSHDTENDKVSCLNSGRRRFSVVVSPEEYRVRFGNVRRDPSSGAVTDDRFDFMAADVIVPNPTGWSAVSVLNPSAATFERLKPVLDDGFAICVRKHARELKHAETR